MTVAGAYAKIEAHEDLCAERYKNIHDAIADLKTGLKWVIGGIWAGAIGVAAWSLAQLYSVQIGHQIGQDGPPPAHGQR